MEFHHPVGCGRDRCETDHGHKPFVAHVVRAVRQNHNFRTAFWTGDHLQMTLMSIPPCGEIGAENLSFMGAIAKWSNGADFINCWSGADILCSGN